MSENKRYRLVDLNELERLVEWYPKMTVESLIEPLSSPEETRVVIGEVWDETSKEENWKSPKEYKEEFINNLIKD